MLTLKVNFKISMPQMLLPELTMRSLVGENRQHSKKKLTGLCSNSVCRMTIDLKAVKFGCKGEIYDYFQKVKQELHINRWFLKNLTK